MTSVDVNDVLKRTQSTANGSTTDFSFSFQVNNTNEIKVYEDSTLKTEGTHYDIVDSSASAGLNANGTGVVKFKTSPTDYTPANNKVITILSVMSIARSSVYSSGGNITAASLEADFDRLHRVVGDFREVKSRTLIAPEYSATDIDMTIPAKATRAGKLLGFNSSTGNPEATFTVADGTTLASVTADIATLADIEDGTDATDAIQTVASNSSNVSTVAGISSAVSTVASNNSNVSAVAGNASNINTVAGNNSNITTVAGISSNVTTVANDGTDIGTVAGISSNVTTVAGIASNVTTVAGKASLITSDFATDMALIDSTFVSKMSLVTSDFVSDMANVTSDFISDLNDLATSAIVEDLNLLATSQVIQDMATLAGGGANPNITSVTASGTVSAGNIVVTEDGTIVFEGATDNANETTLTVADPSGDRTITLPDATGTVVLADATQTLTNKSIVATQLTGTIDNARLNFSFGISNGNVPTFTSGVADDDFLKVNGTNIEGRSASEVATDIGAVSAGFAIAMAVAL